MNTQFAVNAEGVRVHISQVPTGLACRCICEKCGAPMIARKGKHKAPSFAHARSRNICAASTESPLHRYAKAIICKRRYLMVPFLNHEKHRYPLHFGSSSIRIEFDKVESEVSVSGVRPDIVGSSGVNTIFVEVAFSNFIDLDKRKKLQELNIPTLQIDLSPFHPEDFDRKALTEAIINDISIKDWIHVPLQRSVDSPAPKSCPAEECEDIPIGRTVILLKRRNDAAFIKPLTWLPPDVYQQIWSICRVGHGKWNTTHSNWIVKGPHVDRVATELRQLAATYRSRPLL